MNNASTKYSGGSPKSSYIIGLILSIILTIIPFAMVMQTSTNKNSLIALLVIFAVAQIVVHLVYFLHLDSSFEQRWNLIALVFSVIIIAILMCGSLWIMSHLNYNLMSQLVSLDIND
ncbi:cytochrome o ubiquinol oxidase subunit IV [Candidatus Steffania adelgidicola]|uniref:cytochrome o ubiquinol oxidase subunit IV n=1 Tax=Candidatus Steffania adelgidicola TaxID=1076626 RepID=UPI001D0200AC|nr:cytochrome o ubiquinol oxidase subunit IV [Candidatus Steffania adelgidicola]UDG79754.1 Cytochrome bo(3) ubiquinol oxidase subunit 4 [Candidatus Steffania adelgidicola]